MEVDIYPQQRSLDSRGKGLLKNHKAFPLTEFVLSIDPRMRVNSLTVESASLAESAPIHGFYRYTLDPPLEPNAVLHITWDMTRQNKGFVNHNPDYELVENGTYITSDQNPPNPRLRQRAIHHQRSLAAAARPSPGARTPPAGRPRRPERPINSASTATPKSAQWSAPPSTKSPSRPAYYTGNGRKTIAAISNTSPNAPSGPLYPSPPPGTPSQKIAGTASPSRFITTPGHSANVHAMLTTIHRTLDYMTANFAPYPLSTFRILEYPAYRSAAQAFPGGAAYPEDYGFITDISASNTSTTPPSTSSPTRGGEGSPTAPECRADRCSTKPSPNTPP